jgi:hypothetical protein
VAGDCRKGGFAAGMTGQAWHDMLTVFRALGGTADNIYVRDGERGRGIFPLDPTRPIAIHIPENLLIKLADVRFVEGKFRMRPETKATPAEIAFFEHYENNFSWGGGGRTDTERVFEQAQTLPQSLRQTLKTEYPFGDWFEDPTDVLVQRQFLTSRCITYGDDTVIMPILELVNHDADNKTADHYGQLNGISYDGVFSGEVLGRYGDVDPFGFFAGWGFASPQQQAFSVSLGINQGTLRVGRDLQSLSQETPFWIPKLIHEQNAVKLQFLMIGNKRYPRMCRGIFNKVTKELKLPNPEETFDLIREANMRFITKFMSEIEAAEGPMALTLQRMVRYQLEALSSCFGVRDL